MVHRSRFTNDDIGDDICNKLFVIHRLAWQIEEHTQSAKVLYHAWYWRRSLIGVI